MDKIKILIVEDEPIVALDIRSTIIKLGYEVSEMVANYDDALQSIKLNEPDMILMDIHLENSKSGVEIVQEIKKDKNIPVIYLTAFSDDDTMQKAIDTNPVSYLLKPFNREEIKSSILLGIYKIANVEKFKINKKHESIGSDYYYDFKNDHLFYKEQVIPIGINEKKLLKLLIAADGQAISFSELEESIWKDTSVANSTSRTLVYRLRSKLEFKLIETIPTFGYKLNK